MATKKVVTFIKQYFFMLALAATFVGFSAFKSTQNTNFQDTWYYQSDSMNPLDLQDPENYGPNPPGNITCDTDEEIVCSIQDAEHDELPGHPQLSYGDVLTSPQYQTNFREKLD